MTHFSEFSIQMADAVEAAASIVAVRQRGRAFPGRRVQLELISV